MNRTIAPLWRCMAFVCAACLLSGCPSRSTPSTRESTMPGAGQNSNSPRVTVPGSSSTSRRPRTSIETYSARSGQAGGELAALSAEGAVQRMLAIVQDSVEFGPTLVVWFFDISPSAMRWGSEIHSDIRSFHEDVAPRLVTRHPDRLESAVWTISGSVDTPVGRTDDPAEVVRAINALRMEESGREVTFQAVQQAIKEYLPVRVKQRREVLFVIVTDEAGDDSGLVDQLVFEPRKYALPIYVLGVPAPFGRSAALDDAVESAAASEESGDWQPIRQGPESQGPERIYLRFGGDDGELELLDSGFGPFGLERLCRASGGTFLAVRGGRAGDLSFGSPQYVWPPLGRSAPDANVMRAYLPDPLDAAGYEARVNANLASLALHRAAQLPPADVLRDPQLYFVKRSEADLKNRLDKAQQAAAKVAPGVDQLYDLLREGAADAEQLTSRRWRAGFGLAFGRVCAAKARIDGYNAMLAALKRGKSFEKSGSTTWVLQYADSSDAGSSLEKLIARATTLLQRVVDEHPGTPWATIAQHELAEPMGWQWTEQ